MLYLVTVLSGCSGNAKLVITQTFEINDIEMISISYNSDNITFYESKGQQLILKEYMNQNNEKYYADIAKKVNSITIKTGSRPIISDFQSYVEVYLPTSYNGNLSVDTDNGKIQTKETYKLSAVNAITENGAVTFENITAKTIDIQTNNGTVELNNTTAQSNISTDNGKIRIGNASGSGNFDTSSGKIEIEYSEVTGNINAQSKMGKFNYQSHKHYPFNLTQ